MHIIQVLEIQTLDLVFFRDAQMAARDAVDDEEQNTADDKTPRGTRRRRRQLVAHLDPVVFPPATSVRGARHSVKSRYPRGGEEAGEDIADKAADSVKREDVETFVDAD